MSTQARGGPVQQTSSTFIGMPAFPEAAREALDNTQQRKNLRHATHTIRDKRAAVVDELPEWEALRVAGADAKDEALTHLADYLEQLEESLVAQGATVHWARDAVEANRIALEIARAKEVDEVVKVKSMATQEIELNEALERRGISAWETDLAELIVQLGHDLPSHILVPAIHRNRTEIRDIFSREMGQVGRPAPDDLTDDPAALAEASRLHLREKFLRAKVAVSGANFAVAETGSLVVVGIGAIAGAISHGRRGETNLTQGTVFGLGGFVGTTVGVLVVDRLAGRGQLLQGVVRALDVGGVVLAVMELHDPAGDVRFQCRVVVIEIRQGVFSHDVPL